MPGPLDHPRERIIAGMVESAAEHGYAGATVARVTNRAGVSRRTFYEHFGCREESFLAAYRAVAAGVETALAVTLSGSPPGQRLRAMLVALLSAVAADPAAARLAFLEVYAAPRAVRAEHEELVDRLESEVAGHLGWGGPGDGVPQISITALRGGIESVVAVRVLRGEAASLPDLVDDLITWIDCYRLPPGATPLPSAQWERVAAYLPARFAKVDSRPSLLPRGRSALPPDLAAGERRSRILEATVRATAARGYASVTVAEIAADARVTKAVFYSHFNSKQDAFLAAERLRLQESLAAAASAFYAKSDWLDRVWCGLRALLHYLAENPYAALAGMGEVNVAGEEAIRLDYDCRNAFTIFLEDGHRQRRLAFRPLPTLASEAIAGANHGLIRRQVLGSGPAYLPKLLPQLTYVTVAPFVGHGTAIAFIKDRVGGAQRAVRGTVPASV